MFSFLTAFLCSLLFCSRWPSVAEAKLFANCSFGELKSSEYNNKTPARMITISGQLPSTRGGSSHSCVVTTDNLNSVSYLRAKRNKESKKGSLHLSVHGKDAESFLGHLDISKSALDQEWSGRYFCPPHSADEAEKYVAFVGTPGLQFAAEIAHEKELKLDEAKSVEISHANRDCLFQFIPPKDISKSQLDVTVTSNSDVPAYLKVSKHCMDVSKENIRIVDYKGESIRLSFATKGRITLSKVSHPPLTDSTSSWFIGIALKEDSGTSQVDTRKTVTLTLKRSFYYSYAVPIAAVLLVPALLSGVVVAVWALTCFKPLVKPPGPDSPDLSEVSYNEIFKSMKSIIGTYWFGGGPKTFSYITSIVGCVLLVGAFQFVFADWYLMIQEGDRDHCYYNDFCYRVGGHDLPFNLMISNLAYIVHAFILSLSVLWMEAELFARCGKLAIAKRGVSAKSKGSPPPQDSSSVQATSQANPLPPDSSSVQATSQTNPPPPDYSSVQATSQANPPPPHSSSVQATSQNNPTPPDSFLMQATSQANTTPPDSSSVQATSQANPPLPDSSSVQATSQANPPPPDSSSVEVTSQANPPPPDSSSVEVTSQANPSPPDSSSMQATSQANGSTTATNSERLPWHVLTCPNISPHLTTMTVPTPREMKPFDIARCRAEGYKRKFSFSIGYAFAWALLFEGLFSTLYHLCPSKMTFQFDTAFMFLIAGLIVVLQHNGIELEECSPEGEAKGHVGAANFFLGFIVPLYIFNYFGSLYHSEVGLTLPVMIIFFISLGVWSILIAMWAAYRLYPKKWSETCIAEDKYKFGLFVLALILPIVLLPLFGVNGNLPMAFLIICIVESGFVIVWRAIEKVKMLCKDCKCDCRFCWQVLYIMAFSGIMITALVFFIFKPSTNKASTPERSRDLNHECVDASGFFDYHDLWHILSSIALLMGAHLVMYISHDPPIETEPGNDANQTRNDGTDKTTADQGQTAAENRGIQPSPTERNERRQHLHPPNQTRNDGTDQTTTGQGQIAMQNRGFQDSFTEDNEGRQGLRPSNQIRNDRTDQTTRGQGQKARQNRGFKPSLTEINERKQGLHPPS